MGQQSQVASSSLPPAPFYKALFPPNYYHQKLVSPNHQAVAFSSYLLNKNQPNFYYPSHQESQFLSHQPNFGHYYYSPHQVHFGNNSVHNWSQWDFNAFIRFNFKGFHRRLKIMKKFYPTHVRIN